jgi:MAF protein
MAALDLPVEVVPPAGDEGPRWLGESPFHFVLRHSLIKAQQVGDRVGDGVILAADTAVVFGDEVYGKPATSAEAAQMLRKLRGRPHTVTTGVTVLEAASGCWAWVARATEVVMRDYSDQELVAYVASGEPLDKAGAYAVQDERFRPAKAISGCYLNAVGLPLCDVLELLAAMGVRPKIRAGWLVPEQCGPCPIEERRVVLRA